jgi:hypothetical protein
MFACVLTKVMQTKWMGLTSCNSVSLEKLKEIELANRVLGLLKLLRSITVFKRTFSERHFSAC